MHDTPTLTELDLCGLLGLALPTFRRKHRALLAEGLPRHLPGTRVWSRANVLAWIDGVNAGLNRSAGLSAGEQDPANDDAAGQVALARRQLEARLGRGAARAARADAAGASRYRGVL